MTAHHPISGAVKAMPAVTRRTLIGALPALAASPALALPSGKLSPSPDLVALIATHTAQRAAYDALADKFAAVSATVSPPLEMVLTRDIFTGQPVLAAVERDVEIWAAKYRVESLSAQWEAIKEAKLAEMRAHRAAHQEARAAAGLDALGEELERLCKEAGNGLQPILDFVPTNPADVSAIASYLTTGEGMADWVEDYELAKAFRSLAKAVF